MSPGDLSQAARLRLVRFETLAATTGFLGEAQDLLARAGVDLPEAFSRRRTKHVTRARWALWALTRARLGWSYPALAELFGVTHSVVSRAVADLAEASPEAGPRRRRLEVTLVVDADAPEAAIEAALRALPGVRWVEVRATPGSGDQP